MNIDFLDNYLRKLLIFHVPQYKIYFKFLLTWYAARF